MDRTDKIFFSLMGIVSIVVFGLMFYGMYSQHKWMERNHCYPTGVTKPGAKIRHHEYACDGGVIYWT